jgi:hypothetical protein
VENEDEETKLVVYAERENEKRRRKSLSPEEFASYVDIHFLKLNLLLTNYIIQCPHHIASHYRRILQRDGDARRVVFTVLAGGPEPSHAEGKIRTLAIHMGVDCFDQQFSKAYEKFYNNCVVPFSLFLENVYCMFNFSNCMTKTSAKLSYSTRGVNQPCPKTGWFSSDFQSPQTPSSHLSSEQTIPQMNPVEGEPAPYTLSAEQTIPQVNIAECTKTPDTLSTEQTMPQTTPAECEQAPHTLNQAHDQLPVTPSPQIGVASGKPDQPLQGSVDALSSSIMASPHNDPLTQMWPHNQSFPIGIKSGRPDQSLQGSVDALSSSITASPHNDPPTQMWPHDHLFSITVNSSTPSELSSLPNTHWKPWETKPNCSYSTNFGDVNIPLNGQLYHDFGSSALDLDVSQQPSAASPLALPTGIIHSAWKSGLLTGEVLATEVG